MLNKLPRSPCKIDERHRLVPRPLNWSLIYIFIMLAFHKKLTTSGLPFLIWAFIIPEQFFLLWEYVRKMILFTNYSLLMNILAVSFLILTQ